MPSGMGQHAGGRRNGGDGDGFRSRSARRTAPREQAGPADHRHRRQGWPHRRHRTQARWQRKARDEGRRPARLRRLRRHTHPSRQVVHPGALRAHKEAQPSPRDGAAPNYDTDRAAQIRRVFEMAREFDVDIDMHLDSGASAEELDTLLVCDLTEKYKWGGRVAVGHVGKLSTMPQPALDKVAKRMADAGVAATVLTATHLYLAGRHTHHNVPRNVVDLNRLTELGVTCSVGSNNILTPFTPFGDGQLLRQVNMQGIVTQRGNDDEVKALWDMTTSSAARLMRKDDYGITVAAPADLVVLDAPDAATALRTVAPVLAAYK